MDIYSYFRCFTVLTEPVFSNLQEWMMKSKYSFTLGILLLTDLFFSSNCQRALRAMFPKVPPFMLQNGIDPGSPLFLTPYLEKGQADEGNKQF